jgi:hypothetical protein
MNRTLEINGVKYVKQGADFDKQVTNVLSFLGRDMIDALTEAKAIIAGGAVLSNFTQQEVNDVDVYFRSKESMALAFIHLVENWDSVYLGHTDKSITLKDRDTGTKVQFIHFEYFEDAEAVFEAFDFTVCMAAIEMNDKDNYELVMHPQFLSDVASRTLHFNDGTRFPYISALRMKKYADRGYKIGKGHTLAIAAACATIPIKNWEEAKYQLGGVYGYAIDLEMDKDTEFTPRALHDVLTRIRDDAFVYNPSNFEALFQELAGRSYDEYKREN